MRAVCSGELAREVGERDEALGAGLEILDLDLAVAQLVAEDHREMGVFLGGGLELLAQFAPAQFRASSEPRLAKLGRDTEPVDGGVRVGADDDGHRVGFGRGRGVRQREHDPVEPDPEADPGRRLATEELDEPVVTAASTECLLLALGTAPIELERRPGVVVEAADERWLEPVTHAERVEMRPDLGEVRRTCLAQQVRDLRRQRVELLHRRFPRVEQAERIPLESRRAPAAGAGRHGRGSSR